MTRNQFVLDTTSWLRQLNITPTNCVTTPISQKRDVVNQENNRVLIILYPGTGSIYDKVCRALVIVPILFDHISQPTPLFIQYVHMLNG
jgi:hypothetical protein